MSRFLLNIVFLAAAGCTILDGSDPAYPDRPIEIVVGYSAGGGSDQWAQAIAGRATTTLGTPVTVTNIVGRGGLDALDEYMDRDADGYTLMSVVDIYVSAFAKGDTGIDITTDLEPLLVGNIVTSDIYVSASDSRFQSWDDVVAAGQAGTLSISSAGTPRDLEGLSIENLESQFSIDLTRHIIEDADERFHAPVHGVTDILIEQSSDVRHLVEDGTLRPILTLWTDRVRDEVPAVTELRPDYPVLLRLRGLAAHPDTPVDRLQTLKDGLRAAFDSPEYQNYLAEAGMDVVAYPPEPSQIWRNQLAVYQFLYGAG